MVMKLLSAAFFILHCSFFISCQDMLESESTRQSFDPELDAKTDSVFYMAGILNAMQQLADEYVLQNELRGDMADLTAKADTNLVYLADYSYSPQAVNRYDSAYVYYRVINNCNYYIAHRDTTLKTGNTNVTLPEYAAVLSIRAWAYLQAVRQYGQVKYFDEPLVKISQIENDQTPFSGISDVVNRLIVSLEPFSGIDLPLYGGNWTMGATNFGETQSINYRYLMIPVDVMLGELYLEIGNYPKAAEHYFRYLKDNKLQVRNYVSLFSEDARLKLENEGVNIPSGFSGIVGGYNSWVGNIFTTTSPNDVVSYIPMAVNYQKGVTSQLPGIFGYDYYAIDRDSVHIGDQIQIRPSNSYYALADNSDYYYIDASSADGTVRSSFKGGDQRRWAMFNSNNRNSQDTCQYFVKYQHGFVYLYRGTTVYLHLAEALNRMGYPDAAFAVLKDGLSSDLVNGQVSLRNQIAADQLAMEEEGANVDSLAEEIATKQARKYLSDETIALLQSETLGFAHSDNIDFFGTNYGIHQRGCSDKVGSNYGTAGIYSAYQMASAVAQKQEELSTLMGVAAGDTDEEVRLALIDAVEDLLCDEYALEFALEGTRFSDLTRIARHKNMSSPAGYGANYGTRWFEKKIQQSRPGKSVSLPSEQSWYLPFK